MSDSRSVSSLAIRPALKWALLFVGIRVVFAFFYGNKINVDFIFLTLIGGVSTFVIIFVVVLIYYAIKKVLSSNSS